MEKETAKTDGNDNKNDIMVSITLQVFANLRDILDTKEEIIKVPQGITIYEFFKLIRDRSGKYRKFYEEIWDENSDKLKKYVKVIVDGKILMPGDIIRYKITEGIKAIAVFPPIGGG
ncbi:MAG: MoaD/ThiS family protein [Promethearchaeota archaeon]